MLHQSTFSINDLIEEKASPDEVVNRLTTEEAKTRAVVDQLAAGMAVSFVNDLDARNRDSMETIYRNALNVDSATIIDNPAYSDTLKLTTMENVKLIKSIQSKYFDEVYRAVLNNYRGIPQVNGVTFTQRLQELGPITLNRARFIARDQTNKLNGTISRLRHLDIGVKSYRWSSSNDERVVGNPVGLYPKPTRGHGNHYERNNKIYSYDKPFADGFPGDAYNCRCVGLPILDMNNLNAIYR